MRFAWLLARVAFFAVATTAPLWAQDSSHAEGVASGVRGAKSPASGPEFFRVRPEDGEHIDARNVPELNRHISVTLIGVPLGAAIEAIAARAAIDVSYSAELAPMGARTSMKADDVTVAAALAWVLAAVPLDVLVSEDGRLTIVPRTSSADADSSGTIVGSLVDQDNGEPVPYATAALLGTEYSRFADASGHFRLVRLTPRRYVLRARQIGYAPLDTTLAVTSGVVATVTLRMHRIPVLLKLVRVIGHRPRGCVATGAPNPVAEPELATLFSQVRENIDRYRLLLDEYPFRLVREERHDLRNGASARMLGLDTVAYESREHHRYHAGGVVFSEGDQRHRRRYMYLPTFEDLADTAFLATHCFSMGVFQRSRGGGVFRVDFQPADRLRTPDVAGSVYLDAQRLVVRRAEFRLTRSREASPPVMELSVTATFRDFVPFVPMLDSVEGRQTMPVYGHDVAGIVREIPGSVQYAIERDHIVSATFERRFPGDQGEVQASASVDSAIRLSGRVIGANDAPIPGARVRGFASLNIVASDDSGRFVYFGAPPADQILEIRHVGYRSRRILVSMRAPETDMQIALARDSSAAVVATPDGDGDAAIPRAHPVFDSAACRAPPPRDTVQLILYARLDGQRPAAVTEAAWWSFVQRELSAIERSFVLPTDLPIPVFSAPAMQGAHARAGDPSQPRPTVVPSFSSAVAFDVDTVGSVANLRVTTSSLSGVGDTSVLAALERAQADGVLPPVPRAWAMYGPAHLHLLVSSVAPAGGGATRRVGVLAVPEWFLDRAATPDSSDGPVLIPPTPCTEIVWHSGSGLPCLDLSKVDTTASAGDTATFVGVVNTQGHLVVPSVHLLRDSVPGISKRSAEMLPHFTFAPARIGSCAVNEVSRFTVHLPPDQR